MLYGVLHCTKQHSLIHVNHLHCTLEEFAELTLDIVFARSGVQHMLPAAIAIKNYVAVTGGNPNQNGEF